MLTILQIESHHNTRTTDWEGINFYNFGTDFLLHLYYVHNLTANTSVVERKFLKESIFSIWTLKSHPKSLKSHPNTKTLTQGPKIIQFSWRYREFLKIEYIFTVFTQNIWHINTINKIMIILASRLQNPWKCLKLMSTNARRTTARRWTKTHRNTCRSPKSLRWPNKGGYL